MVIFGSCVLSSVGLDLDRQLGNAGQRAVRGGVSHGLSDALIKKEPAVYGRSKEMSDRAVFAKEWETLPHSMYTRLQKNYD